MPEKFEEEIEKILKDHLPQKMFDTVRERIEKVEELENTIDDLTDEREAQENQIETLQKTNERHIKAIAELNAREKELESKEKYLKEGEASLQNLKEQDLLNRLFVAEEKAQFCREVALSLVRNVEYKKSVLTSRAVHQQKDGNGNYVYTPQETLADSSEETIKSE
jgi:hypothetical protein